MNPTPLEPAPAAPADLAAPATGADAFAGPDSLLPQAATLARLNRLFRRSLAAGRIHPLYAALLHYRGIAS